MCLLCVNDTGDWNRPAPFLSWKWDDGVKIMMTVTNSSELLLREVNAFILTCQPYRPLQKHQEFLSPYTCYGFCRVCSLKWALRLSRKERGVSIWDKDNNVMVGIRLVLPENHCIRRQQIELSSSGGGSGGQRGLLGALVLKDLGPRGIVVCVSHTAAVFQISLQWCLINWVCSPWHQPCSTCDTAKCCWEPLHSNLSSIPYWVVWQVI